jgi:hypothetical protein
MNAAQAGPAVNGPPSEAPGDVAHAVSATAPAARPRALVDGSNVAHATEGEAPRLANILLVRDRLRDRGFDPIVVTDAALRHQIDDGAGYEALVAAGEIHQAPAGTDADYFLLSFAKELDASLVSNDRFRDRSRQFAAVRRQIIRFMIVADEVVFERRSGRRPPPRRSREARG